MGATETLRYRQFPTLKTFFPQLANFDYPGESATQAIYTNEWAPTRYGSGETTALADLDFYCSYGCPQGTKFWQSQFSSLYAWSSIGMSYYNAAQITLRHPMSHGLQGDFSYTLSKSIDMGSDAERASEISANGSFSDIINTWNPSLNRAVSDFDTKHLITFDWVYQLPFGHGQKFANSTNTFVDALIGGWQWTGVNRWTSGLPFGVDSARLGDELADRKLRSDDGAGEDPQTSGPKRQRRRFSQTRRRSTTASKAAGHRSGCRIRAKLADAMRSEATATLSSTRAWLRPSRSLRARAVQFTWQVFNVTNSVRFDTNPNTSLQTQLLSNTLGNYSATLSKPRVMQFSLRYSF